jgi:dTDP-D-glucose 4,6-dehydratase
VLERTYYILVRGEEGLKKTIEWYLSTKETRQTKSTKEERLMFQGISDKIKHK